MDVIREQLKEQGVKHGVSQVSKKWRFLSDEERASCHEKVALLRVEYYEQNRQAAMVAIFKQDWRALKRSEVRKYGDHRALQDHDQAWARVMHPDYKLQ